MGGHVPPRPPRLRRTWSIRLYDWFVRVRKWQSNSLIFDRELSNIMDIYCCLGWKANMNCTKNIKGGSISVIFCFCSNLQKWVPNHNPEHYPSKEKSPMLRVVIWHLFLRFEPKCKTFWDLATFTKNCIGVWLSLHNKSVTVSKAT